MKRINYKSDFNFILRLLDCRGDEVGFPDYDWVARFWTGVKANAYEVSCIGGVCKNCYNDDGTIHVVVDNHHLSPGILRVEFVAMLPDGIYPDGDERVAVPAPLDVELVRTAAPCPSSFEVEVILPYIKFRYEDLTDEQKAELMQPAVDAANHAEAVLKDAEAATAEAVRSNRELAANVEAAAGAEIQRQRAEETRVSNEESRQRAEALREDAETKRKAAETARVDAEAVRVSSENARVTAETERAKAETARVTAENARVSAETKREEQEDSRKEAEESRASEEAKRVDAEAKRVTAENVRKTAEQGRVTAESGRVSAEEARVEAERERATEFESWQSEIDTKPDRTELSNILGNDTEGRIEEIEPGIVIEALRKVPQILTPEEQAVVKNNIGVSKMEPFCDMFSNAAGSYGYARITDGEFDCELNGLKLTYEEAVLIYNITNGAFTTGNCRYTKIRTNLWNTQNGYGSGALNDSFPPSVFSGCSQLEVARISYADNAITWSSDWYNTFTACPNLRKIIGVLGDMSTRQNANCFTNSVNLEEIKIYRLAVSFNIPTCPKINCESIKYWVENRSTTNSPITITVHPDVYAKLTDETNEEWHKVLTDALAKNISFATV